MSVAAPRTRLTVGRIGERVALLNIGPHRLQARFEAFKHLALTLVPLAAITWWISVRAITANLTDEFTSKGTAIARSLASSAVDLLLTRDASTVQGLVDGKPQNTVRVDAYKLYTLRAGQKIDDALLELRFSPGVQAYAFTFG